MTDVLHAIFKCDLKKLKVILRDNGKINHRVPGTEGCTPLHLLVGVENVIEKDKVLSYFLDIGADPNARSDDQLTPVHIASMWNNCSELEKLLQSGGNPWLTDNENKNAFDLAKNNHAYEAYQLLHKYLAEDKLNFRMKQPKTSTPQNRPSMLDIAMIKSTKNYSQYLSTHENFPLYFSSDEESTESFTNISRILSTINKNEKSKHSWHDDPGRVTSNKGLMSDICSTKFDRKEASKRISFTEPDSVIDLYKTATDDAEIQTQKTFNSNKNSNFCSSKSFEGSYCEVPAEQDCNADFLSLAFSTSECSEVNANNSSPEFVSVILSNKSSSYVSEVPAQKNCNSKLLYNEYNLNHNKMLNDNCDSNYLSVHSNISTKGSEVPKEKNCNSDFSSDSYTNKYFSISNVISTGLSCNSKFLSSVTDKYCNPDNENLMVPQCNSTSDGTDIYSFSESEFIILEKNSNDAKETIIETDAKSGITLVEKTVLPVDLSSTKYYNMSDSENYCATDWKGCSTICLSDSSIDSHWNYIFVPPDYRKLSNIAIYSQLKDLGDDPGPITNSTREAYLQRLTKLKSGCKNSCALPKPKYANEVYMFLEGKFNAENIQAMMSAMYKEFNSENSQRKWREGNQKSCFNYFLLDPRVTLNLPSRMKQLTFEKAFLTFLDAIFYIGKGSRARPYSHLIEAAKVVNSSQWKNDKVAHILDIWKSGNGVISLHCFNNCIPAEAYTHEACLIDAVGLENLTNMKNGNYYGVTMKWKWSWKRKVGVELLHRALQIFILEGERQIFPKDI